MEHIGRYGSQHTETIVTEDRNAVQCFTQTVDSSAVLVNASTRFNDGFEFGLAAEIGISTDKFHARGPCGLQELCSYKYVVWGDGGIRDLRNGMEIGLVAIRCRKGDTALPERQGR